LNFQLLPTLDRSDETMRIGWNTVPQTGHFEPFIAAALVALSANDCCFAISSFLRLL
jgi:hypothetical protein